MRFLVILLGLCLPAFTICYSQNTDPNDTTNIRSYPDHFFLWPVLKERSLNFAVRDLKTKESVRYKPNNSFSLGMGAYVFDVAFEITFAIPVNDRNREIYGRSTARDLQVNALGRRWGADLYTQRYSGFYSDDPFVAGGGRYPQRADITARNTGLTGIYVFSPQHYSLRSAFNFSERQLVSGGSFMITATLNGFKMVADSAVLDTDELTGGSEFRKLRYTTFSVAPGYAYTFVRNNMFISGALMAGPAHNWIYYQNEDSQGKNDIRFNTFASLRLGVGYTTDSFFTGLNFVQQSRMVKFDDIRFTNNSSTFRLFVGFRFREFGILKKGIGDLPRELMLL